MMSSRKRKRDGGKRPRPGAPSPAGRTPDKRSVQTQREAQEIPPPLMEMIENQRGVLITVVTLLHCLHVVLEHGHEQIDAVLNPGIAAAARWASLPEITTMVLERTHAVISALDSINFTNTLDGFKP
jgi:hypothetical protein